MHSYSWTCHRWRASALAVACALVLIMMLPASAKAETKEDVGGIPRNKNSGQSREGNVWNPTVLEGARTKDELIERLDKLPKNELESLAAYYKNEKTDIAKKGERKLHMDRESILWTLLIYAIINRAKRSIIDQVLKFIFTKQREHTCYACYGCFYPENRMGLGIGGPVTPGELGVKFFFHNSSRHASVEVNVDTVPTVFKENGRNLTIAIIHGFKESSNGDWIVQLKDTLLENVNCNVITVDWNKGAEYPKYAAAAANTPLVGAALSLLLQSIYASNPPLLKPEDVHLVGFSLGAHAAGFCGRHFYTNTTKKLGRITGLDPAGPLFENPNISLSSTDATFVDVIHTNGGPINDLKFGLRNPLGDVDFYPNYGADQPGCPSALSDPGCSHSRAPALFIESVNKSCSFKTIPCEKEWFEYGFFIKRNQSTPAEMGFYTSSENVSGIHYLRTSSSSPYCIPKDYDPVEVYRPEKTEKKATSISEETLLMRENAKKLIQGREVIVLLQASAHFGHLSKARCVESELLAKISDGARRQLDYLVPLPTRSVTLSITLENVTDDEPVIRMHADEKAPDALSSSTYILMFANKDAIVMGYYPTQRDKPLCTLWVRKGAAKIVGASGIWNKTCPGVRARIYGQDKTVCETIKTKRTKG